jgi:hypothetical protein
MKNRDSTHSLTIRFSLDVWSANLTLPDYGRVARHPPSSWEGILLQSQLTDVETKPLSHSVITCLRDR